jgi:uncharacterized protein YndB with AHSA1/START domain
MDEELKYAGVSSQAVAKATGKGWAEWLAILDAAGAREMKHPEIASYLAGQQGVPDWWSQMVTVGYEQARGLRSVHEKADGFAASASRTINAPAEAVTEAFADPERRRAWLGDAAMEVRKATPGKSVRITWGDGSGVDANLTARGEMKCQVAIQHSRLPDAAAVAATKAYWTEALDRLKAYLEG